MEKQHYVGIFYTGNENVAAYVTFEGQSGFGPLGNVETLERNLAQAGMPWTLQGLVAIVPQTAGMIVVPEAIVDDEIWEQFDPEAMLPPAKTMWNLMFRETDLGGWSVEIDTHARG